MPKKINFTIANLDRVTCPPDGRAYVYDSKTPGLQFCKTSTGATSFYLYRRVQGRPARICLGSYPQMTIEQARDRVAELNGDIAKGVDPVEQKHAAKAAETFGGLFDRYMETHAKVHKKTWQDDQDQHDRYLESWRGRIARKITKSDVRALHTKVGTDAGPYSANRLLSLIHAVYSKTDAVGADGKNPASGVQRFPEQERERFLHPDEVPAFFKALDAEPSELIRDYIMISILVGARRSNVCAMRWEDVNLERATWTIPDTKSGNPVTLALATKAVEVLKRRKRAAKPPKEWVFPSHGVTGHLVEPKAAWANILKAAGIKDLRIHDLRRTLGSWQAAAGASLTIIGKSLGHKSTASTKIYARLHLDPVRASVQSAATALLEAREAKTEKATA